MSNIIQIQKGNRVLTIPVTQKESYLSQGYNMIDQSGNVIEYATSGATVSVAEYQKVLQENEKLKAENHKLRQQRSAGSSQNITTKQSSNPRN